LRGHGWFDLAPMMADVAPPSLQETLSFGQEFLDFPQGALW
jgi:hypothetical protein